MKTLLLSAVLLSLAACDPIGPMVVPSAPDAGQDVKAPAMDADGDAKCMQWGMNSLGQRFCLSTEPDPCPGPWGCAGK